MKLASLFSLSLLVLSACVPNKQLRTELVTDNCIWDQADCRHSMLERYPEYDLGFIEFTERGNLYNRSHTQNIFNVINQYANTEQGVAVFVFVHGWKHNADFKDSNLVQFRDFLSRAAETEVVGKRKVFGLYLGWRGDYTRIPVFREVTYWARKSVAEEIGSGGATEIFSRLHQILVKQFEAEEPETDRYRNSYVVIGHSFGGAIVLSALHDVLLKDLIDANPSTSEGPNRCQKIRRFADALILLNPAIEANRAILLKEAAARCIFDNDQPKLMHVLSSDGDIATRVFFPVGQTLNVTSTPGAKKLVRRVNGKDIILDEDNLDRITVGNLPQLRTGFLSYNNDQAQWMLADCRDNLEACGVVKPGQQANHFPTHPHDPLAFIKTDKHFIKNHNDVFGCYAQSFISTIILETQALDSRARRSSKGKGISPEASESVESCDSRGFDFRPCFGHQLENYDCDPPS